MVGIAERIWNPNQGGVISSSFFMSAKNANTSSIGRVIHCSRCKTGGTMLDVNALGYYSLYADIRRFNRLVTAAVCLPWPGKYRLSGLVSAGQPGPPRCSRLVTAGLLHGRGPFEPLGIGSHA